MRVFIAGATGVLGRRLVERCADRGHDVVGLTRDEQGATRIRDRGGEPHRGDVLEEDSLVAGAADADVVVHAATKIPTDTNPSAADWQQNDRVRREGARNLVSAATEADADRFLQQSIVWVARQPDGEQFDETADPNPDPSTQSALDAERHVLNAGQNHGFEPVVLRGGWFYAHDTAHTQLYGERLLASRMPIIAGGLLGREDATLSFVHVDDAALAFAEAIEGDAAGVFHVVDDRPTTYAEFLRTFADRLETSSPRRIPAWLARLFIDEHLLRLITCSMPTTNERFREAFDWEPRYPTVEQGLDEVVDRWRKNGLLRKTEGEFAWTGA
jgi:nucleoside-diphosphate-sugar epimerase